MPGIWVPADWPAPAGVIAGYTLRTGGVSVGNHASLNLGAHVGDDEAAVKENRRRFIEECGLPREPAWLSQVHGCDVAVDPRRCVDADAVVGRHAGSVCAVMIADCLPVILAATDGSAVAAAHAGWRGLAAGVLENTVRQFEMPPDELIAWLGPAISRQAFEVGNEVRQAFVGSDDAAASCFEQNETGRWMADLYGLARLRLQAVGVRDVYGGGLCTYSEPDRFFSYRRDGQCGRMAAFVFRNA